MKNNKGFTISELLVSVTIFGIVLAAIFGFMLASAKSYNKVNDRAEIQERSRTALNLLEEYVIDCNGGIAIENTSYEKDGESYACDTLYIFGTPTTAGDVTSSKVDIFRLDDAESVLEYGSTTATQTAFDVVNNTASYSFAISSSDFYKVAEKTVNFDVAQTYNYRERAISGVKITIGMNNRSADYSGSKNIALRNTPPKADVTIELD